MKNKLIPNLSMKKSIYVSGALLVGIVICMSVFFGLREHKERELQGKSNFTLQKNGISTAPPTAPRGNPNPEEDSLTLDERIVQSSINNFMSLHSEDELATPEKQKKLEIMNSPEYLEFRKNGREKGYRFRQHADFWESHGFPVERWIFKDAFRKEFPTGEPDDYEPEMRLKMAKLLLSQEPAELTDPREAALQRQQAALKFIREDGRNIGWLSGQFGIDHDGVMLAGWEEGAQSNPAFIWMTDVQRNAASIVANAEAAAVPEIDTEKSAPSWDLSSVMESPSASHSETGMPTTPDTSASVPMTDAEIEAESEKSLTPQLPDITTNQRLDTPREIQSNLETALREQFSSERFERAMSTLDKYGPEEGLRRLRENDPEVAKQIENARHRNKAEVSR